MKLLEENHVIAIVKLTEIRIVEHPKIIRRIHRFFNPVHRSELRDHEARRPADNPLRKPSPDDAISRWEVRRTELLEPNNVSYAQVYVMLALTIAAVAIVLAFVAFR